MKNDNIYLIIKYIQKKTIIYKIVILLWSF